MGALIWREATIPLADLPRGIGPSPTRTLIRSVSELGVLSPVLLGEIDSGELVIVDGNRRITAARLAGLETIPARVAAVDRQAAAILTTTANAIRNSNPAAEVAAIAVLIEAGFSETETMARTGMPIQTIRKRQRLIDGLIPEFGQMLERGRLTVALASALSGLPAAEQADVLASHRDGERLTLRLVDQPRRARRDTAIASLVPQLPDLPQDDLPKPTLTRTIKELQALLVHLPPAEMHQADRCLATLGSLLAAKLAG